MRPSSPIKTSSKKSLFKRPWFYIITVLVILALGIGSWGYLKLNEPEPQPKPKPPTTVELSEDSPAYAWLSSISTDTESSSREKPLVSDATCEMLSKAPKENMYTSTGQIDDNKFTIQILAPGTSGKVFAQISKDIGSCWPKKVEVAEGNGFKYIPAGDGFIGQVSDTLVYLPKADEKMAQKVFSDVLGALKESTCIAAPVKESDYNRNKFFSKDNYTGLVEIKTVESTLPLDDLPKVNIPKLNDPKDPDMDQPEGPLASEIPEAPEVSTKPTFTDAPEIRTEPFTSEARYQISDVEGPGCGWGWTKWNLPDETDDELEKSKEDSLASALNKANTEANAYLNKQSDWAAGQLIDAHAADEWNAYVSERDTATDKWTWLNKKRSDLKPKWDKYVKDHDFWTDFEKLKQDAKDDYRDEEKRCEDAKKEQEDWDQRYDDTNGNGGGNTGIPKRPKGCDKEPEEPKIISQDRPKEPLPPELEKGVTVPDSWDQPK